MRSGQAVAVGLVAAVVLTGCVGTGVGVPVPQADSGAVPRTYAEIEQGIFATTCAPQCHQGGAAPKGLSLEPGRALELLVGVPSAEVPDMMRVAPGQPDASYLVVKLVPFDPRRVGARMPRNGPPFLTDAQVRAIRDWIAAGARDDWDASQAPLADALMPPSQPPVIDGETDTTGVDAQAAAPDGDAAEPPRSAGDADTGRAPHRADTSAEEVVP